MYVKYLVNNTLQNINNTTGFAGIIRRQVNAILQHYKEIPIKRRAIEYLIVNIPYGSIFKSKWVEEYKISVILLE